ncbi:MAG: tRNA modification GTPase MnmE [Chlamydiia bacterium]|nr:tRNA modification GTPase MnmE [Chlamydiia bacterium]MCH9618369.1 tRNA modification GTPase MnmE [Chlamydiia bacterium]MCH9624707.1 tRNA modification GTPase MnmE [Chlamydiia bacterium]
MTIKGGWCILAAMDDVIVAIATPPGIGALSIIRLSGKETFDVVNTFFSGDIPSYKSHTAHFGRILDPNGGVIDEVILLIMKGKRSFTGENSIEIICHGNPLIAQKILRRALEAGARAADGGEFSRRAFSNGKVDLLQAEAIKEMIHAKNERALKEASKQLGGSLSIYIKDLQRCFIDILAIIEVHIDYPEEGIEEATKKELISIIDDTKMKITRLLDTFHDGKKLFSGHMTAIIGAPNAGKSSLLNALLEENRAIVTDTPGTTRDTIEEEITIDGHTIKFVDTAGIRESSNEIEKIGIEKALAVKKRCDITILLVDLSTEISDQIKDLYNENKETLVVYNKNDLCTKKNPLNAPSPVYISAKNRTGLESLKKALISTLPFESKDSAPFITKERHYKSLTTALKSLETVLTGIEKGLSVEYISFDLREGLESLSEIIGINVTEEILGGIFSKFCVGK